MLIPDKNIIAKISAGDLGTFESVFRDYYENLCRYALRILNDSAEAEEVVQDLFYSIWEKRQNISINISLNSYLYKAVHNRCIKYLRHRNVEEKYRTGYHEALKSPETPEENTRSEELYRIFEKTLDSLPLKCSAIFRMNRFEGLKYKEIADRLSVSVKTVEANMGRALKMLRKNLKDFTEVA
jgi:RNA polymerase sigma-70 factor, ECF subfamily